MIAHIRRTDEKRQSLEEHCRNVKLLMNPAAEKIGLRMLVELIGLLHDMGKATMIYIKYLEWAVKHPGDISRRGSVHHSPIGAIFAYERWYRGGTSIKKITAQIISMAIGAHHGGYPDCVTPEGISLYLTVIQQDKHKLCYSEAVSNFLNEVASEAELDRLFEGACQETEAFLNRVEQKDRAFTQGLLARLALSLLVDADRWDTACFENNEDPFQEDNYVDWDDLSSRLEKTLSEYDRCSKINEMRGKISDNCVEAAGKPSGIYTLTVPTGGGKTLSSLRFALKHAKRKKERIFYIIPFNTILEQNSVDIREALEKYNGILDHYGTFISELEDDKGELEEKEHVLLTERWNMPIIMTSIVQFLNTLFRAENSNVRRMHRLVNSILIFDEIQALPKHCTVLFEKAIQFLVTCLNCTVLLCTATQPCLKMHFQPLLPVELTTNMFDALKRTQLIDESNILRDNAEAARNIAEMSAQYGSVLVIVNTKAVAAELFNLLKAKVTAVECIHLSTNMCPTHRFEQIQKMKVMLKDKGRTVICISTMLIEAGVNISFPCVIRSMAGLPNIMQAAGRCNRHMEMPEAGRVYIWRFAEENLSPLEEIRIGQSCTYSVMEMLKSDSSVGAIDSLGALDWFFVKERNNYNNYALEFPWTKQKGNETTLTEMLDRNRGFRQHTDFDFKRGVRSDEMRLFQAFSTAGHAFQVINQDTLSILVPYGVGANVISMLCSDQPLKERIRTQRQAQQYTVSIWRRAFERLSEKGAIYPVGKTRSFALYSKYYDNDLGLLVTPKEMDFMNY